MRIRYLPALALVFFSIMPLSMAFQVAPDHEKQTTDIGSTMLWGIITHPRYINSGHELTFRAIFLHYRSHWMGTYQTGTLHMLQKVIVQNDFKGFVRNHLVCARFDGVIEFP